MASGPLQCSSHLSCGWAGRKRPIFSAHHCPALRVRSSAFSACRTQHRQLARAVELRGNGRTAQVLCKAAQSEASIDQDTDLVGEDAAYFDVKQQTTKKWTLFTALLIGVLGLIYVVRIWLLPRDISDKGADLLQQQHFNNRQLAADLD